MNYKSITLVALVFLTIVSSAYFLFTSHSKVHYIYKQSNQVIERQYKLQHAINTMQHIVQKRIVILMSMTQITDEFELDDLRSAMRDLATEFLSARDDIISLAKSEAQLNRFYPQKLRDQISANAALQNQAADLLLEGQYDQAMKIINDYNTLARLDIISGIAKLDSIIEDEVNETKQKLNDEYLSATANFEILGLIFILVVLIFISIVISRLLYGEKALKGMLAHHKIHYKAIINTVQDGVITLDHNGIISSFNPGAEKIFKIDADNIIDRKVDTLIHRDDIQKLHHYISDIKNGIQTPAIELTQNKGRINKETIELSLSDTGIDGTQSLCGIIRDVTQQKKAESEFLQTSKLESIGVLAGGIAHDFNNILVGVSGHIEMARISINNKEKALHHLDSSFKAVQRAASLTQQLLTFAKGGSPIKRNTDIKEVIKESTEFSLHGSNINVTFNLDKNVWLADVDSGQISQVIQNLVINSKQAMPEGGDLIVSCSNCTNLTENDVLKKTGKFIQIKIQDDGDGISPENINSIFDPYFTTKDKGAGLGLALSYSIVNKHNGVILVDSSANQGTCFTIYLPASNSQKVTNITTETLATNDNSKKRVLVMDDDDTILAIANDMLNELGYITELARTGEEAIATFKDSLNREEKFDLLIMDLTIMGGMGGKQAIQEILDIQPDTKAIVSSGYSNDPVMANHKDYGFTGAMTKPYDFDILQRSITQCLQQ